MSEVKVHKVKYGNTERYSFSKIKDVLDIPYLIEVQKNSYKSFLEHGIKDVLDEYSPIRDFSGIVLHRLQTRRRAEVFGQGMQKPRRDVCRAS